MNSDGFMLKISAETACMLYLVLLRHEEAMPGNCDCETLEEGEEYICIDCQAREALTMADGIVRSKSRED